MGYANTIDESRVTLTKLQQMKQKGEKFSVLTAYDSTFAQLIDQSGIGAGPDCDAQVLVLYDMLGITRGHTPKFAHNFLAENRGVLEAIIAFDRAVNNGHFPAPEHCY
jgi:3-methyl-2-oxobutanoate hydroxymethyltransferase